MEDAGNNNNNNNLHCSNGDIFNSLQSCMETCKAYESNVALDNGDLAQFKLVELYTNEYRLSNTGFLSMTDFPYTQFTQQEYILTNESVMVCYPLSNCFSDSNYWTVEHGNYYQFHFNRHLWVKLSRQLATLGDYYIWNHTAVVCYPNVLDNPMDAVNGIACVLSAMVLFAILTGFCKLEAHKLRNTSLYMYVTMLSIGYLLQGLYYFYPCPKPILLFASKYNFICSLLWLNLYTIQLLIALTLQSVQNPVLIGLISYRHGVIISIISVTPCWIQRLRNVKTLDLMGDSCTFPYTDGINTECVLDGVLIGLVILSTLTLHVCKFQLSRLGIQLQNSTVKRLYRLTANLCVANSVYTSIKLTKDILSIKQVSSWWFYVDMSCQWFGFIVFFILQCDSHLKKLCERVGNYYYNPLCNVKCKLIKLIT